MIMEDFTYLYVPCYWLFPDFMIFLNYKLSFTIISQKTRIYITIQNLAFSSLLENICKSLLWNCCPLQFCTWTRYIFKKIFDTGTLRKSILPFLFQWPFQIISIENTNKLFSFLVRKVDFYNQPTMLFLVSSINYWTLVICHQN